MNDLWISFLCRKSAVWKKMQNSTINAFHCKNVNKRMENRARELDEEMLSKRETSKQKLESRKRSRSRKRKESYQEAESVEVSVQSEDRTEEDSFSSSHPFNPQKRSLFAMQKGRSERGSQLNWSVGRSQFGDSQMEKRGSEGGTLYESRLNTSVFNRRMIFAGEHGIFGAKTENEFLEDKRKARRVLRKRLFEKSYLKEVDSLVKQLKVN